MDFCGADGEARVRVLAEDGLDGHHLHGVAHRSRGSVTVT
jgi:hypothetical protein